MVVRILLWPRPLIERLFPPGSAVVRYYWLMLSGVQIIILNGWSSFRRRYDHYRRTQKKIGRWRKGIESKAEQPHIVEITPDQFASTDNLKVAVVVHAYYFDVFDEICGYLKNMPCRYALLVSVKDEDDRRVAVRRIESLPAVGEAVVKVVHNRGRDIKPFLVDFGTDLLRYDYICKIHTKKSLFKGAEDAGWRRYLCGALLGSQERIRAILTMFEHHKRTGIIYPDRYPGLPYWAYTWLSNRWIAAPIVQRLGFKFDADEYIEYPAGSMFWIRKEALKPLLGLGITEGDFPEEIGQTDGTMHHLLERCFTLSAQAAGMTHALVAGSNEHVFLCDDRDVAAPYFHLSAYEKIRQALPQVDVASFDIFDTLLCRPFASPDMVFHYLEECVKERFGVKGFAQLRRRAEDMVRMEKGATGDVKLSEIYARLAGLAGITAAVAGQIMELEIQTETSLLIPREGVMDIFEEVRQSGKRVILTTDTYFERGHIERMLSAKGIGGHHRLYISSEEGKRKDRGDMWDFVIDREGIKGHALLHVGDNEQSDLQKLGDRGPYFMVHVMKPSVLFRQSRYGRQLWQIYEPYRGWRENLLYGLISNHFCLDPYPYDFWNGDRPLENPRSFGYVVFGPLIHNFIAWLIDYAVRDGIGRLYFLSREGYALKDIYDDICAILEKDRSNIDLPVSSYLLCSRRAALFACLRGPADRLPFLDRRFTGTLRYLFEKRLYVNRDVMQEIEKALGAAVLDGEVSLPEDYDRVRDCLYSVCDILLPRAEAERRAMIAYCVQNGLDGRVNAGLVDVGYSCTIQRSLIELLCMPLNGYYFATDESAAEACGRGSTARGYLGERINPVHSTSVIFNYSLLLEAVLTSPQGQLIRFSNGGGVVPVFKPGGISQRNFGIIREIHRGMKDFVSAMYNSFGKRAVDVEFPVNDILCYYQMVATGEIDIGGLKKALSVEDEYSGNPEIPVIDFYASRRRG